jgi:hypothetical protein
MENQQRFYKWMLNMKNIHLADNEKMSEAFARVAQSDREIGK